MSSKQKETVFNRCDVCGRFISCEDFYTGAAKRTLIFPDSLMSFETWETLCKKHNRYNKHAKS